MARFYGQKLTERTGLCAFLVKIWHVEMQTNNKNIFLLVYVVVDEDELNHGWGLGTSLLSRAA